MLDSNFLNETFSDLVKYANTPSEKVINYQTANSLKQKFNNFEVKENSSSQADIKSFINKYLTYSVNTGSKQFFNQLFAGRNEFGILAEMLSSFTNSSMYTFEMAPVATLIELKMLELIANKSGFTTFEGKFVSGGSHANLAAMMVARNLADEQIKKSGIGAKKLVAFVSEDSHYSYSKGANVLGIGINNVIKIKADAKGKMMSEELEKAVKKVIENGQTPFFIGATAGTTVFGAFDDINALGKIAKKYKIWLHVDGAFGGPVIFSKDHSKLITGLHLANSFAIDFHKILGAPLTCSAILINGQKGILKQVFDEGEGTDYIFHESENSSYDLGPFSLQCGRKVDVLKLYFLFLYYGLDGVSNKISDLFNNSYYAKQKVIELDNLDLVYPGEFLTTCFQYVPKFIDDQKTINEFNFKLRQKLLESGLSMVNQSNKNGKQFIRLITVNFNLTKEDLDLFFTNLITVAKKLKNEYQ